MMYIVKCHKCNNQSVVDIKQEDDKKCRVCGAEKENVELVDKVKDVMPSPEEIAEGLMLKL